MTDLTRTSFSAFVQTHHVAVIHFWASWNGYDIKVKDTLEKDVPAELRNQIAFGRLDIDPPEHWDICKQHNVLNVPFLAFYRDGVVVETVIGAREPEVIIQHLRKLIS